MPNRGVATVETLFATGEGPARRREAGVGAGDRGEAVNVQLGAMTDAGRVRKRNEDAVHTDPALGLVMIADGMGGHSHGEVASSQAIEIISQALSSANGQATEASIESAIHRANETLFARNSEHGYDEGTGMGTTVVGAVVDGSERAVVFHVGDSRLYLYRDGDLHRVTRDHTLYESWKESGGRGMAPKRNVLMRAVGVFDRVEVEVQEQSVRPGDALLFCSDGLTRMLPDSAISGALGRFLEQGPDAVCEELVRMANERGGKDNISVALAIID